MSSTKKTLVVGLDAACWNFLDPLLERGQLPTLRRLMDTGVWGTLHSTMPAWTPTAWASVVTGKNPGKHGIFDMMWLRPGTYEFTPTNSRFRLGTPIWNRFNEHGLRVGLVNVPFTYPLEPLDGFAVAGFGSPGSVSGVTYPNEILSWIENRFGPYEPWLRFSELKDTTPQEKVAADIKHQEQQIQMAIELAEQYPVDILMINLMVPDHANHLLPHMEQVEQAYRQTDADLNKLIQSFGPDNIMVISDHGSRRVKGDFLLHAWLRDHGYCKQVERTPAERVQALNWILVKWLQDHWGISGPSEKLIRLIGRGVIPRLPEWVKNKFWNMVENELPFARENHLLAEKLDFTQTPVFVGSARSGLLYLNIAGREQNGVVSSQDKAELLAELVEKLKGILDPDTDQPLFSNVYTAQELYEGAALEYAPDIVLDFYDSNWNILHTFGRGSTTEKLNNKYFVGNFEEYGHHSRDGMFVFTGPDFSTGPAPGASHLINIPATLLYLYGVPIPEDYDSRVMSETLAPEFVSRHPVTYQPGDVDAPVSFEDSYTAEDTEELVEHLRALGYVD